MHVAYMPQMDRVVAIVTENKAAVDVFERAHELALDGCRVASKLMRERMIEHAKHLWAMRQVTLRVKDDETGDEAKPISMET